ncbi:aminotransferase class I/II-fold pyridoxal phosphate-dependent enzyme [Zobellia sp. KMM 6746]|uniref:cysteine-S-conjugate beta-lyase n=2 Tax=Zobellia barbeyronii TaxID=2748009 RepID=A0ABS5WH80_9FLAO|nr:aminotransferase class I/II-fold pyridoxal phosphate-dependent enzyme [Zobellia barbeyronii]
MSSNTYQFNQVLERKGTNAMSVEGYRGYLFDTDEDLSGNYPEEDFIKMWVADMEFAIAPEIINAMKERLEHPLLGYSMVADPSYALSFLQWCIDRYKWRFNIEHLVHAKGVIPALYDLIGYICKADEKVLIVTPSYAFFKHGTDYNEVELVCSDLIEEKGRFRMDMDDIKKKASDEKCVLAVFCNPHNPTGRLWSQKELLEFGQVCLENGLTIISDEIHCDVLRKDKIFTPLASLFPNSDKIITCMAPSKTFNLAGNLFANIIIPNDELRTKYNENYVPVENPLSIVAAKAAYSEGHAWLIELTDYLDDNFKYLKEQLDEHLPHTKFIIPDTTYLAWVNVSYYFADNENLTLYFARNAGVLLEGGNMFVANADGYIRLNLACPRVILEEGLRRVIKAVLEK